MQKHGLFWGSVVILLGILLLLNSFDLLSISQLWPLILVIVGLFVIIFKPSLRLPDGDEKQKGRTPLTQVPNRSAEEHPFTPPVERQNWSNTPVPKPVRKGAGAWLYSLGVGVALFPNAVFSAASIAFVIAFIPVGWAVFKFILGGIAQLNVTDPLQLILYAILTSFIWAPIGALAGVVAAVGGGIVGAVIGGIGVVVGTLVTPLPKKVQLALMSVAMGGAGAGAVVLAFKASGELREMFPSPANLWIMLGVAAFGVLLGVFQAFVSREED